MDRIVILGAGFAGLTIAAELDAAAEGKAQVTLVDRNASFQMGLAMEWVLAGRRLPDEGQRWYGRLRTHHVRFVHDEVVAIDASSRVIVTKAHRLEYDHLVVALGAELAPELVPGLAQGAYNLCDMSSVAQLRDRVATLDGGRVVVLIASVPFKCPPAPYEYALLIDDVLRRRGARECTEIVLTTPEPQPMPVAGKAVGDAVKAMLAEHRIEFRPGMKPRAVDAQRRVVTYEDGSTQDYTVLAAMPPHRAPQVVRDSRLTDASGFVPVKLGSFETEIANVYAVGDLAALKLPNGSPHPKAGVFAEAQGFFVARTLLASLGMGPPLEYTGEGVCYIDVGDDKAAPVRAHLLHPEGPRLVLEPPSALGLDEKRQFERERLEKWFET